MGRQRQRVDRAEVRQLPEGCGEQGKDGESWLKSRQWCCPNDSLRVTYGKSEVKKCVHSNMSFTLRPLDLLFGVKLPVRYRLGASPMLDEVC